MKRPRVRPSPQPGPVNHASPPAPARAEKRSQGRASAARQRQAHRGAEASPPATAAASWGRWSWLLLLGLVVAVLLVYQPARQGGLLFDDDAHVTRPELRCLEGLRRIWFQLGATQQYYPLLHSFFWVQWQLWGDSTLGYHLVNVALHAAAAVLVAIILRRLAVPGAYLAAAIFALHPVQVESVAWITEQKNTLSAVFYLAAALMYLRFDRWSQISNAIQMHRFSGKCMVASNAIRRRTLLRMNALRRYAPELPVSGGFSRVAIEI